MVEQSPSRFDAQVDPSVIKIAKAVAEAGGRALLVGGWVRDVMMGGQPKDLDVEVYGLQVRELEKLLGKFGTVIEVGRAFGVFRLKELDVDFSLPRRDSKVGAGHKGFDVEVDPHLSFVEAARRRDLTMNSMGYDPLSGELLDPHHGAEDLKAQRLRATDPIHFSDDPLRALRVAQFAARFNMTPDPQLHELCAQLDLSELSGERVREELVKLLLKGKEPSVGFTFLENTHLLRFFPELQAMVGVPQDPQWHPEGDVWVHTKMVVDEAARGRDGGEDDLALMLGALCHDFGKPSTTVIEDSGRVRSPSHESAGVAPTEDFLLRYRFPKDLVRQVCALVRYHLAPALFVKDGATDKGYRRLARKLGEAGVSAELLVRVAWADHLGRTTEEALAREFPAAEVFLRRMQQLRVEKTAPRDVVLGRHLIARGLTPGPHFKEILERCRDVQDETGWEEPDRILDAVLAR